MILPFLKIGDMADFANVKPGDHEAHDENVDDGKEEAKDFVGNKCLIFDDSRDIWPDRVIIKYTLVYVSEDRDCGIVKELVGLCGCFGD